MTDLQLALHPTDQCLTIAGGDKQTQLRAMKTNAESRLRKDGDYSFG
jgi:hypothetical protein